MSRDLRLEKAEFISDLSAVAHSALSFMTANPDVMERYIKFMSDNSDSFVESTKEAYGEESTVEGVTEDFKLAIRAFEEIGKNAERVIQQDALNRLWRMMGGMN